MKTIEELCISPTPWKCATDDNGEVVGIENGRGFYVVRFAVDVNPNDARLIAAAPKLYECLRLLVNGIVCSRVPMDCANCPNRMCVTGRSKALLAEAAGESEVRHGNS